MSEIPAKRAKTAGVQECRACLAKLYDESCFVDIFRAWDPAWSGMGLSIAEDLAKLTNIEINVSDPLSKNICKECCSRLQDAIRFTTYVQTNDMILRERFKDSVDENPLWPKPIQVDKSITSNALNEMTVEVKQEVLTEDEYESNELTNEQYNELGEPRLDIKIEPEEIMPAATSHAIEVNGPYSLQPDLLKAKENGVAEFLEENTLEALKEEPITEDEAEPPADMPKDCMLCFKTFHSVKGLKTHVIAVHSYDSVTSSRVDRANVCTTCNKCFATPTDLFVHERGHRKLACYVCDKKFNTIHQLTKHRSEQCTKTSVLPRLNTLDDVRRIARYRGTETLQLFDLHVPIERIKELKIDGDECRKIMMGKKERKEKNEGKNRKVKDEIDNEVGVDQNDLHNVLKGNVMSVIVNLRMPVEDMKVGVSGKSENVYKNAIRINNNNDMIIPKTEPELNCNDPQLTDKNRHKKIKKIANTTNLYAKQYKPNRSRHLYNPLSKHRTSLYTEKDETKDVIPLEQIKVEIKQEIKDEIDSDTNTEAKHTNELKKQKHKYKIQRIPQCKKECKENIPKEFRLQVFEHYWSLSSFVEQRSYIRSLLDRKLFNNKIINTWRLKLGTQCFNICRTCLSDTLGLNYSYFHHTERLLRIKSGKPKLKGVFK